MARTSGSKSRTTCANPQLLSWLQELCDEQEDGSNYQMVFRRAWKSMKECPDVLARIEDAARLKGIGPKINRITISPSFCTFHDAWRPCELPPLPPPSTSSGINEPAPASLTSQAEPILANADSFLFTYLDVDFKPVRKRDDAHFRENMFPACYLIQYPKSSEVILWPTNFSNAFRLAPRSMHTFLSTQLLTWSVNAGHPLASAPNAKPASQVEKRKLSDLLHDETRDESQKRRCTGSLNPARQLPVQPPGLASTSFATSRKPVGRSVTMPSLNNSMPPPPVPTMSRTTSMPIAAHSQRNRGRLSSALPTMEIEVDLDDPYASAEAVVFQHFDPIIRTKKDRDGLAERLERKGVPVVREALEIGDVAWKAVRRSKRGDAYDEVALDVILERKRFDDLWISIKDNRFHEQKFRLHNSALTKVFYVVESYDAKRREDAMKSSKGKSFDTAISSTQIIDRFRVKETNHINDTIAYYAALHEMVKDRYKGKPLHIIPSEIIRRESYLKFQKTLRRNQPHREYLTTFAKFQELNSKSGFMTARETWAKQLLRINKMSAEKAGAIVQVYPCSRTLRDAFRQAEKEEKEDRALEEAARAAQGGGRKKKSEVQLAKHLLKDVGQGIRFVGESLSEKVYDLMMAKTYAGSEESE
ncbi:ERCC4 domain-containing protein [Schizophyllum amplum]|uniref:Crossover junction endonuclease MUS81 n=1 Tax=Schizophyllum amplum TaxID=97359 RepID=A0A550C8T9_9AGAR|nr:ERCC4 domain-containing protein [Auriculariopsis ampla]